MEITTSSLLSLQNGSYYLSNTTGEIKKAGLWQWFKCATGLGDGREKVLRLAERIKNSLLADASLKSDDALSHDINALDKTKSLSSSDLKRIAGAFKTAHSSAIAKSDAMREAKVIVEELANDWVFKSKTVCNDPETVKYMKQLALYAARPVIENAEHYADNKSSLVTRLKSKMGVLQQAVGALEVLAHQAKLGYPMTRESKLPGREKPYDLGFARFVLDELHFRFLLATLFVKDGNVVLQAASKATAKIPEAELMRRKDAILSIKLGGPEKSGSIAAFLGEMKNVERKTNELILSAFNTSGNVGKLTPDVDASLKELVDEARAEFGEEAVPQDKRFFYLIEGQGDRMGIISPIVDEANKNGKIVSGQELKEPFRAMAFKGAAVSYANKFAEKCLREAGVQGAIPSHLFFTLCKTNPAIKDELAAAKTRADVEKVVNSHIEEAKTAVLLNQKLDSYTDDILVDRAAQKLATALGKDVEKVKKFVAFKRLTLKAEDMKKAIADGKYPGCREKNFDVDAAFEKHIDGFVKERVDILKEIDGMEGLTPQMKKAWKNSLLKVENPKKTEPHKLSKLLQTRIKADHLLKALEDSESDEAAFAKFCDWALQVAAEFISAYGEEDWIDFGPDGRNPIYDLTLRALVNEKPEILEKFKPLADKLSFPSEALENKYAERGSSYAIAMARILAEIKIQK